MVLDSNKTFRASLLSRAIVACQVSQPVAVLQAGLKDLSVQADPTIIIEVKLCWCGWPGAVP